MPSWSHPFSKYISGSAKLPAVENTARSFLSDFQLMVIKEERLFWRLKQTEEYCVLNTAFRSWGHETKNMAEKTSGIPWLPFHCEEKSKCWNWFSPAETSGNQFLILREDAILVGAKTIISLIPDSYKRPWAITFSRILGLGQLLTKSQCDY